MKCNKCGVSDNGSGDWAHVCGTVNIKAGADIHAGDGGYSLGTQEKYNEFVKGRNQSLGKARIRELVKQATSIVDVEHEGYRGKGYTEQVEFFDKEKFAELIVAEMLQTCEDHPGWSGRMIGEQIKLHFGVEE